MTLHLRLMGRPDEVTEGVRLLQNALDVLAVTQPEPARGNLGLWVQVRAAAGLGAVAGYQCPCGQRIHPADLTVVRLDA